MTDCHRCYCPVWRSVQASVACQPPTARRSPTREQRKRLLNGITPELMKISGLGARCDVIVPAGPTPDYMVGCYYSPTRVCVMRVVPGGTDRCHGYMVTTLYHAVISHCLG